MRPKAEGRTVAGAPNAAALDALWSEIDVPGRLQQDPLGFVPRTAPSSDVEVTAYLAAALAMGNLKAIGRSVSRVVARLDALSASPAEGPTADLSELGHRWVRGDDIARLVGRLRALQARFGSIEGAFLDGYRPGDVAAGLARLSTLIREGQEPTRGLVSMAASPMDGSACKRLNLFLRWVVRPADAVDLGLWRQVDPADLIAPLDVHVVAFARRFGLVSRTTTDWRFAEALTGYFRRLSPADPMRWDFVISHYGMMSSWEQHAGFGRQRAK